MPAARGDDDDAGTAGRRRPAGVAGRGGAAAARRARARDREAAANALLPDGDLAVGDDEGSGGVTAQRLPQDDLLRFDERAADAVLVVLDTAGRVDRRRRLRLVEAVATLIAFAPRFRRAGRRREAQP